MDIWQAQPWQEAVTYRGNAEWLLSAYGTLIPRRHCPARRLAQSARRLPGPTGSHTAQHRAAPLYAPF